MIALIAVVSVGLAFTNFENKISEVSASSIANNQNTVVVCSYVDVFRSYYEQAALELAEGGYEICEFEPFCDNYYLSDMNINDYTVAVVNRLMFNEDESPLCNLNYEATLSSSSSGDADYILSDLDYYSTPKSVFKRKPIYSTYNFNELQNGDIVNETITTFYTGHTALIYDTAKRSDYGNYIQTIEAVLGGVQFGFLDDTRFVDFGVQILRVVGVTSSNVSNVKLFCRAQLGKSYDLDIMRLQTSIDSPNWYCSEMVYAAFYYVSIDIGVKKDSSGNNEYLKNGCLSGDIANSYNTYKLNIADYYLIISLYDSSKLEVKITNDTDLDILFEYNSKLCFLGDAQKWTGLKDIKTATISAGETLYLTISQNWFADTFVLSWCHNGRRLISYGDYDWKTSHMTPWYRTIDC